MSYGSLNSNLGDTTEEEDVVDLRNQLGALPEVVAVHGKPASKPKKIQIEGEDELTTHIDKSSDQLVQILCDAVPSDLLGEFTLKIEADDSAVEFALSANSKTPKEVTFRFNLTDDGRDLHIDLAQLGYAMQNRGLVKSLMKAVVKIIENEPRVERLSLNANLDVGGYAWARYGFEPDKPDEVVMGLKERIGQILANKSFDYDGFERAVELPPPVVKQLEELQKLNGDPLGVFRLLANTVVKVKVPSTAVVLPIGRFPGGSELKDLLDWHQRAHEPNPHYGTIEEYEYCLSQFGPNLQRFSDCLSETLDKGLLPGTGYRPDVGGQDAIRRMLDALANGNLTTLEKAQLMLNFTVSATAPDAEVSLSALFMLGAKWDGHVNLPQGGSSDSASVGWKQLKKYIA